MVTPLILTFVANDRPGLVDALSREVTAAGGNWLESRTAHMAGKFAGIVHVDVPDRERAGALKARLAGLAADGIAVTVDDTPSDVGELGVALVIELVGPDQPGIVRDIAHCLAAHRASIDEMDTETSDAPMGGGMLFHARIEVRGPADMDEAALRGELERIAGALMVDINLREPG
ncbi:MAG: hypothetical protein IPL47_04110 [Phyllobacteriaceae bacterium]|nr:hypothetical protein [Phyllobacteriaceae bacterium]